MNYAEVYDSCPVQANLWLKPWLHGCLKIGVSVSSVRSLYNLDGVGMLNVESYNRHVLLPDLNRSFTRIL